MGIRADEVAVASLRSWVGGEGAWVDHEQGRGSDPGSHGMHVQDTVQNASGIALPRVLPAKLATMVIPIGYSHHHLNNQTKNK